MATLGLGRGIFQYKRLVITGLLAWMMHRGYHVLAIPTWERKLRVLVVWLTALVTGRDIVSLLSVQDPRGAFVAGACPRSSSSVLVDHVAKRGIPNAGTASIVAPIGPR